MKEIKIRITSNPFEKSIFYYVYDEKEDCYKKFDSTAKLSSKPFTNVYIEDKSDEILSELYDRYYVNDDTELLINFIGNDTDYKVLRKKINENIKYNDFMHLERNSKVSYNDGKYVFDRIREKCQELGLKMIECECDNVYQECMYYKNNFTEYYDLQNKEYSDIKESIKKIADKKYNRYFLEIVNIIKSIKNKYVNALKIDPNGMKKEKMLNYFPNELEIGKKYKSIQEVVKKQDIDYQKKIKDRREKNEHIDREIKEGFSGLKIENIDSFKEFPTNLGRIGVNLASKGLSVITGMWEECDEDNRNKRIYQNQMNEYINKQYSLGIERIIKEKKNNVYSELAKTKELIVNSVVKSLKECYCDIDNVDISDRIKNFNVSDDDCFLINEKSVTLIDKVNCNNPKSILKSIIDIAKKDIFENEKILNNELSCNIEVWSSEYIEFIKKCFEEIYVENSEEFNELNKLLENKSLKEEKIKNLECITQYINDLISNQIS